MNRIPRTYWMITAMLCATAAHTTWGHPQPQQPTPSANALVVVIRVADPSGAVVAGAKVRVAPVAVNAPEKMETNEKGELALQLQSGRHALSVLQTGFQNFSVVFEVKTSATGQVVPVVLQVGHNSGPVVVEDAVTVNGLVLRVAPFPERFIIRAEELKAMPRKTLVVHNPHANTDEKYEGVLLADLLTKYGAPLGKELRGPALENYVVATGSDGYKAVYSLAEVDPSFHPGDVLVADTMDGKPLDSHTGPFRLVSTEDKRPARAVRNLVSLEVKGE